MPSKAFLTLEGLGTVLTREGFRSRMAIHVAVVEGPTHEGL